MSFTEGQWVRAKRTLQVDGDTIIAKKGAVGRVINVSPGGLPSVLFKTITVCGHSEIEVFDPDGNCLECGEWVPYVYMVDDQVWKDAVGEDNYHGGHLHLDCLERRLPYQLEPKHFSDGVKCNEFIHYGVSLGRRGR